MWLDLNWYLPDDILVKVDRAAMACSLETRVPLLDRRIVEFALSLPTDLNMEAGIGKRVLREVLYRHVPREMVERPKQGFAVPLGQWLRTSLRDWAESLLDENRLKREGYFYPTPIRRLWKAHLAGVDDHAYALWGVLMFQAWLDIHKV
jgi:asparagine synthase (glutamine-hydrolysing)